MPPLLPNKSTNKKSIKNNNVIFPTRQKGYKVRRSQSSSSSSFDATPFAHFSGDENIAQNPNVPRRDFLAVQDHTHKHELNIAPAPYANEGKWDWDALDDDQNGHGHSANHISSASSEQNHAPSIDMTSPSALNTFDYPRKTTTMFTGGTNSRNTNRASHSHQSAHGNFKNQNSNFSNNSVNARRGPASHNVKTMQELPNPTKLMDQGPFRNRFASAALVSQRFENESSRMNNRNKDTDKSLGENEPIMKFFQEPKEDPQIPTQLFLNHRSPVNGSRAVRASAVTDWPTSIDDGKSSTPAYLSKSHEWPISPAEDSFESFGNQSAFSDITGSELSNSVSSPRRTMTKGANISVFRNPTKETLLGVQEEEDFEKQAVNNTASTQFSSGGSYSDGEGDRETNSQGLDSSGSRENKSGSRGTARGKKQSRLISLFASRGLNHQSDVKRRAKSAPKSRFEQNKTMEKLPNQLASPVRSHASESSSGHLDWPGTIGRDGTTVPIISSFNDARLKEKSPKPKTKSQLSIGEQRRQNKLETSKGPLQTLDKKQVNKKVKKGLGRKLFERKQKQKQNNDKKPIGDRLRVSELTRQFEGDVVDLDEVPSSGDEDEIPQKKKSHNPADVYLARVVRKAKSASSSPSSSPVSVPEHDLNETYPIVKTATLSNSLKATQKMRPLPPSGRDEKTQKNKYLDDESLNSAENDDSSGSRIDVSASLRRVRSALSPESLGSIPEGEDRFRLSEEALKMNERLSPVRSNASGANVKGFLGFLNPTQDVPNLMDDDSCTTASTRATEKNLIRRTEIAEWNPTRARAQAQAHVPPQLDVFDGVASISGHSYIHHGRKRLHPTLPTLEREKSNTSNEKKSTTSSLDVEEEVNVVKVNTSLATIQTSMRDFDKRTTSKEYDANLSESDTDFFSSSDDLGVRNSSHDIAPNWPTKIKESPLKPSPSVSDNESEVSESSSSSESLPCPSTTCPSHVSYLNLSKYAVDPSKVRKLVKNYRTLSNKADQWSTTEDSKKAFALFEMRSRIMETDIERGIDRTGGTKIVDDIVLTPYYQASHRVRDAVVVSKAWREGANPSDARTAFFLTTGIAGRYHIKRQIKTSSGNNSVSSELSKTDFNSSSQHFVWEKVLWVDDTDFSLLRCPSLGPNTLRGFDIFTVGDCQSILLKLTNDYCEELRSRVRDATSRQLVAEHIMKEEAEGDFGAMTEAEDAYLEAMDEVKTLTNSLNRAEKAFEMTKEKIENLVSQYENMLIRIDKNPDGDSNCGDDDLTDDCSMNPEAKDKLTRRAQRAELRAEVASREAQMAKMEAEKSKQEVERIRQQKEKELTALQQRLDELEAKSALMSDFESNVQKQITLSTVDESVNKNAAGAHSSLLYAASTVGIDQDKNAAKERIKARFRQRRAVQGSIPIHSPESKEVVPRPADPSKQKRLSGSVQQRLQFYERSLQAVDRK